MNSILLSCYASCIFSIVLIGIGIGICIYNMNCEKKDELKETIGIVVGFKRKIRRGMVVAYYVFIEYDIGKLSYNYEYYSLFKIEPGTKIKIMYNPNKPQKAIIKKNDIIYLLYFIGVIQFAIALALAVVSNNKVF